MKKWERVGKFAVVGGIGFVINYVVLVVGVAFGMRPSIAGPVGAEGAIVFGFAANNLWTFAENRISSWRKVPFKFLQYNIVAFGSVVIQFAVLRLGEYLFGLEHFKGPIINWPLVRFYTWYMFFFMWGVGIGMVWNFIMYSRVVWGRRESAPATAK
jgi:putative flippase GtrA